MIVPLADRVIALIEVERLQRAPLEMGAPPAGAGGRALLRRPEAGSVGPRVPRVPTFGDDRWREGGRGLHGPGRSG